MTDDAKNVCADHLLEYVEEAVTSYLVQRVEEGVVYVDYGSGSTEDIQEAYLWCATCQERIGGLEAGAGDDGWYSIDVKDTPYTLPVVSADDPAPT
jgi:hypothetical protein